MVVQKYKICPRCTNGCTIFYLEENGEIRSIKGATCPKGENYVRETASQPDSIVFADVYIKNGVTSIAQVKTSKAVPGHLVESVTEALKTLELEAPIEFGEVLIPNYMDSGTDLVAKSTIKRFER